MRINIPVLDNDEGMNIYLDIIGTPLHGAFSNQVVQLNIFLMLILKEEMNLFIQSVMV